MQIRFDNSYPDFPPVKVCGPVLSVCADAGGEDPKVALPLVNPPMVPRKIVEEDDASFTGADVGLSDELIENVVDTTRGELDFACEDA